MQETSRSDGAARRAAYTWAQFEEGAAGHRFETRARTITEADVVAFGTLTGDMHPAHMDATWAATGQFGQRIAHGLLVLAYAIGLMGFDPDEVVALRRVESAVFKRPVRLGDTIRARGRVTDVRALTDELGQVRVALKIVNQRDQTVISAALDVLWRRAPAPDQATPESNGDRTVVPL